MIPLSTEVILGSEQGCSTEVIAAGILLCICGHSFSLMTH